MMLRIARLALSRIALARRAVVLLPALLIAAQLPVADAARAQKPKLVVVLVVDQMRYDYLTRFAGLYKGGLKRLADGGAVFTNAHHDHALTVTAVGHAAISTGAFPSHNGIVENEWFDRASGKRRYVTDDPSASIVGTGSGGGQSPRVLLRDTLGDWLKRESPQSRVFSVAFKDRSAIVMGGMHAAMPMGGMGAGWKAANGSYGMVFTFTTG